MASAALPMSQNKKRLLFICMGNICRSPALAAVFMDLAKKKKLEHHFFVDSAALTTFYIGQKADYRMCKAAQKKGIAIDHKSRLFEKSDFSKFDYILAVNHEVKDLLYGLASSPQERQKILLATAFAKKYKDEEIADPYFHGGEAFDHVMEMAFDACDGLLEHLL
jgi:protein-tyrosine phosphatase